MKVFVINLDKAEERRRAAERQLSELGIDYEIFSAVDKNLDISDYFKKVNKFSFLIENGYFPPRAEIACYASHLTLWKKCVTLAEPIVVLEDDFLAKSNLKDALTFIERLKAEYGYIRLEPIDYGRGNEQKSVHATIEMDGEFSLKVLKLPPARSTGYMISPKVAQAFIDMSIDASFPVDHIARKTWVHGHTIYAIAPPVISQSEASESSTISGRKKSFVRHFVKPLRLFCKYRNKVKATRQASISLQTKEPI